jgi:hypothetical protein
MGEQTLTDQFDRARKELEPPPGQTPLARQFAGTASTILACLRYAGLSDEDIRPGLENLDPGFVVAWADQLKSRNTKDARDAGRFLDELMRVPAADLREAMAMAAASLSQAG